MGKIDRIKEQIGALKVYLAIVVSLMVTIGAGVAKLFLDNKSSFLMWLGIIGIILLSLEPISKIGVADSFKHLFTIKAERRGHSQSYV